MLNVQLVDSAKTRKEFLEFPARLFSTDPNYIRPLDKDIEEIFNPGKNKNFAHGSCERFLFKNKKGETVGKVAVFISPNYQQQQPTGGIGFFDCINEQKSADFIFDFCKKWLQDHGAEAMDGPINFGERDKFWGLLTEGFQQPLYGMNYNAPYYRELFENYGFQVYFHQLCFTRPVYGEVSRAFTLMHARHARNTAITARHMDKKQPGKFAADFAKIYNKAWASHGEGKTIKEADVLKMFRQMAPVINEHICWFAYAHGQPVAMWINIPDLNRWFRFLNGKMTLWHKLKFLAVKSLVKNTKMVGLVFGVVPEWQRSGIEGFMIWEGTQHIRKATDFEEIEMQWIGDFNPKMIKIAQSLGTETTRQLTTYRYLFDRERPFERHPVLQ